MVKGLLRGALGSMLMVGVAAGLGACNTMEGFGKDMSAAGRALSGSAERTKNGGSPFSASNSGNGAAESTNATASNAAPTSSAASGPPTPTSPSAGATSGAAPVTPVTPVN